MTYIASQELVEYVHRYEYSTKDAEGNWSEPEVRYHNPTSSEEHARRRHEECRDVEFPLYGQENRQRGIYGYAWKNDVLVKRTTVTTVIEEALPVTCGAVAPRGIYPREAHVEPCKLAPRHDGAHRPGNEEELTRTETVPIEYCNCADFHGQHAEGCPYGEANGLVFYRTEEA